MKQLVSVAALALALGTAIPVLAQQQHTDHHPAASQETSAGMLTQGEVKKIDKEAGKLTIKHGPIANLDMPGMTMVFRVKDPAMLDSVKAGDAIHFKAEKVGGGITVTQMQVAR